MFEVHTLNIQHMVLVVDVIQAARLIDMMHQVSEDFYWQCE